MSVMSPLSLLSSLSSIPLVTYLTTAIVPFVTFNITLTYVTTVSTVIIRSDRISIYRKNVRMYVCMYVLALLSYCGCTLGLPYMLNQLFSSSIMETLKPGCPRNVKSGETSL